MSETITTDSDVKIDKIEAIVGIYKQLFEMTTDDQLMLINKVNFLHQNGSFVYKKEYYLCLVKLLVGLLNRLLAWVSMSHLIVLFKAYKIKKNCCIIYI